MKRQLLYIVCSVLSLAALADTGWQIVDKIKDISSAVSTGRTIHYIIELIMRLLVFAGWCIITYHVITRKHKWVKNQ